MSSEIKECPFCGGKAERVDICDGENNGGSCICCTVCQASSNVEFGHKENFVSNWNRRAAPASAEPVAWRRMNSDLTQSTGVTDIPYYRDLWTSEGDIVEPLYAGPRRRKIELPPLIIDT